MKKVYGDYLKCHFFVAVPHKLVVDKSHFRECLLEMLSEMFGAECISKIIKADKMTVTVNEKVATINVDSLVSADRTCLVSGNDTQGAWTGPAVCYPLGTVSNRWHLQWPFVLSCVH